MSNRQIDFQDVLQLVELIKSSSNFSELRLRSGDIEVELRRAGATSLAAEPTAPAPAARPLPAVAATRPDASADVAPQPVDPAPAPRQGAASRKERHTPREGMQVVTAPMVGTVYHAAEPGATPFVKVGQSVAPGDQICIIEVMKLMNSINADCHGVVTEILVADGEAVEYGQELYVISAR